MRAGRLARSSSLALALLAGAVAPVARGADAPAPPGPAPGTPASPTVTLAARSIGSRRGEPPRKQAHAALLIRIPGVPGGFIVQGGPAPMEGWLPGRSRVAGWVIPCADPAREFTRAAGAWWGEAEVRELPTTEIATFVEPGLTEARIRAIVAELDAELRTREYRLEKGPSSNSFVSRFLQKMGRPLPPIGDAELPGWGWTP